MKKYIIFLILIIISCGCINNNNNYEENTIDKENYEVKVKILEKEYLLELEENDTVREFLTHLPLTFTMNELNGNEKYYYMDFTLPRHSSVPNHIEVGDVMLYQDNCLVLFYQEFDTTYSYTRIGHINGLENLGDGNIQVTIIMEDK